LDITKHYLVNISYSFNLDTSGNTEHDAYFAIRNDDSSTYDDVSLNVSSNQQLINLTFYFQPTKSVSVLYFLAACQAHDVVNTFNDIIIWNISEIQ
jgi:hypothetical protein